MYVGLTSIFANLHKGENILTPPSSTTWYEMLFEKFKDPIILILIIADIFSFGICIFQHEPFWDPLAILAAILITTLVGWWQDMSSKSQFDSLNKVSDDEYVKVYRDANVTEISKSDLYIGDVVILSTGDECPADMRLLECTDLHVNEAAMTGESEAVTKFTEEIGNPTIASNIVLRGTNITEGNGVGIVIAIGDNTEIGKTTRQAREITDEKTPLTIQLGKLADKISTLSFWIGGFILIFLNIAHYFGGEFTNNSITNIITTELHFIMIAVVIIIAAVPEGLALSVVLALAYSVKAMMKDNNLVKKMKATETVGAVNIIFSDKTGTITQNKMTVVHSDVKNDEHMYINGAINSTVNLNNGKIIGNPTEGAILNWLNTKALSFYSTLSNHLAYREKYKVIKQVPFNSTNKYMMSELEDGTIYYKGAPEIISKMCNDSSFLNLVTVEQKRGRRAISFAHSNSQTELIYDGTVFIEDPVRPDVHDAIDKCYKAGINVVMMTGDNIQTATEIAHQAGFRNDGSIEASNFLGVREDGSYPNVIARCKPDDKLRILNYFQNKGYICAMTGDGVNDSPSLNHADVGIAMGSGTSVAKEASDIVLLDDAFPSIVKGIKWGRSLYKNIQSFLAFQLTVNIALCLTAITGPICGMESPFSIIQILYINLVMDALGALALASEPAMDSVLEEQPRDRNEFIINHKMLKFITINGCVLFIWMLNNILRHDDLGQTGLFAIFMMFNFINLFRARTFGKKLDPINSLKRNPLFICVAIFVLLSSIAIIQFGGDIFGTRALTMNEWGCVLIQTIIILCFTQIINWIFARKS